VSARALTCLPTYLPAHLPACVPACRCGVCESAWCEDHLPAGHDILGDWPLFEVSGWGWCRASVCWTWCILGWI
jgi:hypothetical protein